MMACEQKQKVSAQERQHQNENSVLYDNLMSKVTFVSEVLREMLYLTPPCSALYKSDPTATNSS